MAAVMVLIMLPVLACVAVMLRIASFTVGGTLGAAVFSALAVGVLTGAFRFVHDLDGAES